MSLNINGKKTSKDEKNRKLAHIFKNKIIQLILFFIAFLIFINVISYFNNKESFKPDSVEVIKGEHKKEMDEMDILMEKLKKEKELRDSKQSKEKSPKETKEIKEIQKVESKSIPQLFEKIPNDTNQNTSNSTNKPVKKEQKMTRYEDWVDEPEDDTNTIKQEEVIKKNELMKNDSEKDTEVER